MTLEVRCTTSKLSRSEEHTSELQSRSDLVCRLLLEKKKKQNLPNINTQQRSARIKKEGKSDIKVIAIEGARRVAPSDDTSESATGSTHVKLSLNEA